MTKQTWKVGGSLSCRRLGEGGGTRRQVLQPLIKMGW